MDWKEAYQKFQSLNNNVLCYCKMPYDKFEIINLEFSELFTIIKAAAQQGAHLTAFGVGTQAEFPLLGSSQADESSATNGGG